MGTLGVIVLDPRRDDLSRLDELVDWKVMRSRYWNDTAEEPDRKRRRQAEFLVHEFFPWSAIEAVGVFDRTMVAAVEQALAGAAHRPKVKVERGWYY